MMLYPVPVGFGDGGGLPNTYVITSTDNYNPANMYDYMVWKGFEPSDALSIIADPNVNKRALANALTDGATPGMALTYGRDVARSGAVAQVANDPDVPPQYLPGYVPPQQTYTPPPANTGFTPITDPVYNPPGGSTPNNTTPNTQTPTNTGVNPYNTLPTIQNNVTPTTNQETGLSLSSLMSARIFGIPVPLLVGGGVIAFLMMGN